MYTILYLVLSSLILYVNCHLVELQNGIINGTVGKAENNRLLLQFYGIPFAEPPVRDLRFKPPVPVKPWAGIKNCTEPRPNCIQPEALFSNTDKIVGNEDCLYLNVFVPKDLFNSSAKIPVMVIIHGGAFVLGAGTDYYPDYFMNRDVIFVSINYRLGALGFFGMNNDVISGNFGMKDQSMALRWVHENIERFGGDPGKVTLVGTSTGAASVHLHMFSPLSQGLFHRAIMQSGSAFASWSRHNIGQGEATSTALVIISGCFHENPEQILKCLQRIPAEQFFSLEKRLRVWNYEPYIVFKPMIETNVKNQPFLTQKPSKNNYLNKVPWITGINSGEGALTVALYLRREGELAKAMNLEKIRVLPLILEYYSTADVENVDIVTAKVVYHYFGTKSIEIRTASPFVDMVTDSAYLYPLTKTVHSQNESQYVYLFDQRGPFSYQSFARLSINLGVAHADELPFLFRNQVLEYFWKPAEKYLSEELVNFWANFTIFGDPNGNSAVKFWKPVKTDGIEYLHIRNATISMEEGLFKERFQFWNSLLTGWKT